MPIDNSYIQALIEKADIESVISSYVTLKRTGKNLKGLCPFHNEKTASFTVFPDTRSFYCFGCGAAGDAIGFLMKIENLDYVEAVKSLAQQYGMPMPEDKFDDSFSKIRMRIYSANREAAKFFNEQLYTDKGKECLEYFNKRYLSAATIRHFGLGYAPNEWDSLTKHLKSLGYTEQELILANLCRQSSKTNNAYDNFRNRAMFPIIDLRGNVIAFGGRVLDDSKPKYINTSDTPVYKKSNGVFALNFAKNCNSGRLILVEGYMDVITLHQAGFTEAIACLGTAFTSEMASLLSRYANEVLICYDNDDAGRKATQRALEILGKTGLNLKVIKMDGGKDADEIIKAYGPERFKKIIEGAANKTEYAINQALLKYPPVTDDGKHKFLVAVSDILAVCDPLETDIYVSRISNEYNVRSEALLGQVNIAKNRLKKNRELDKIKENEKKITDSFSDKNNPERELNLKAAVAEETLIYSFCRNPDYYKKLKNTFSFEDFVTDFNKRLMSSLGKILDDDIRPELSMFSPDFSETEMSSVHRILYQRIETGNTLKECQDCIAVLKSLKSKITPDVELMDDDEWSKCIRNLTNK